MRPGGHGRTRRSGLAQSRARRRRTSGTRAAPPRRSEGAPLVPLAGVGQECRWTPPGPVEDPRTTRSPRTRWAARPTRSGRVIPRFAALARPVTPGSRSRDTTHSARVVASPTIPARRPPVARLTTPPPPSRRPGQLRCRHSRHARLTRPRHDHAARDPRSPPHNPVDHVARFAPARAPRRAGHTDRCGAGRSRG